MAGHRPTGGAFTPTATTVGPAHNLGVLYEVTGDLDRARQHYELALSFDEGHAASQEALQRLGQLTCT